jgi:hypothetical protein
MFAGRPVRKALARNRLRPPARVGRAAISDEAMSGLSLIGSRGNGQEHGLGVSPLRFVLSIDGIRHRLTGTIVAECTHERDPVPRY